MSASTMREIRRQLHFSQAEFAAALGVALETMLTWDSGRRPTPAAVIHRAQTLTPKAQPTRLTLPSLARELHVHVRTLRAAARDGRLAATFATRPFFGHLRATAAREAGDRFMEVWYRRTYGRGQRRLVPV